MAGPWELYATAPAEPARVVIRTDQIGKKPEGDGPWTAYAEPTTERGKKTLVEKLGETWPAQLAKSVYSAATLPGDVLAGKAFVPASEEAQSIPGSAAPNDAGAMSRAGDLMMLANPMSVATRAGAGIFGVAKTTKPATPTVGELKAAASAGYEAPAVKNLEVRPQALSEFSTGLQSQLNEAGFDNVMAPKTFNILNNASKIPAEAVTVTGNNLRTLQKSLGKAAGSADATEAAAASKALSGLNKHLENFPAKDVLKGSAEEFSSTVTRANKNYSAAKAAENIDKKKIAAELRAATNNSGMNVANTIRQRMADVVLKPKESRGLLDSEIATAKSIAEGTRSQNALRAGGTILGGGGGMWTGMVGAGGVMGLGPVGAALPVAGYAMKALSNRMTVKQAERFAEAIRSRAPLASSVEKYEAAAAAMAAEKNAKTVSTAAIAARNLTHNLKTIGITASIGDLMRHSTQSQ